MHCTVLGVQVSAVYGAGCGAGRTALSQLSLKVRRGECCGLIGLNGAGKSTVFRLVSGEQRPAGGRVTLAVPRLGLCPQEDALDLQLTCLELLSLYGRLTGLTRAAAALQARAAVTNLGLAQFANVKAGQVVSSTIDGTALYPRCAAVGR